MSDRAAASRPPVFGVERSILGQAWRWRGGRMLEAGHGAALGLDDLTAALCLSRGAEAADIDRLLKPTLRDWLPDPSIFRDMERAATRLADAVEARQRITIYGDYDVDGATSAALLIRFLRGCGVEADAYIPDRLLEGYGPSGDALERLARSGAELVVTVDCGTQAFEALAAARAAGLDVIVVDHHQASTALPEALALVNPNRLDEAPEAARFGHLAAVGMAFLLAVATNRLLRARGRFILERPEPRLMDLVDLVALGTVADVARLTGLNRAFVAQGLKVMAQRGNIGLAALADVAGIDRAPRCSDLGFKLGPRINAGGRVGKSDLGVRLLTTEDAEQAQALARELDRLNGERQAIEAEVTEAAFAAARLCGDRAVAVVAGEGWHPGVIGIVAGLLRERLGRPAIVIARGADGWGKGSGRSMAGVDLGAAVLAAKDSGLLAAGGGHAMAAGLTVAGDRIEALTDFLCARLAADVARAGDGQALSVDCALAPGGITAALADALSAAGPYGMGWPGPRVAAGPFSVVKCDIVGDNHLRLVLAGADGARLKAVAFRQADTVLGGTLMGARGRRLFVAGRVERDDWNGREAAELHLEDAAWAD